MSDAYRRNVVEAALLAAGRSLQLSDLAQVFTLEERPSDAQLLATLEELAALYADRALELAHTASGWRVQVRSDYATQIARLWPERPARYSRALLETLALIAYRQPITRGEIEQVRGVAVNPNIIKTLLERNWIRVIGTRDVPGRPEVLGTTAEFLDYFGLQKLEQLPPLAELRALAEFNLQLELADPSTAQLADGTSDG
ncbi:MAG TPA: SMC-Scp complex subunit ScpB [Steroidobacteraceae bacterium]|nr:SMC-Scp complex subunit ScpB [Steroidobacteraceae bacterium]